MTSIIGVKLPASANNIRYQICFIAFWNLRNNLTNKCLLEVQSARNSPSCCFHLQYSLYRRNWLQRITFSVILGPGFLVLLHLRCILYKAGFPPNPQTFIYTLSCVSTLSVSTQRRSVSCFTCEEINIFIPRVGIEPITVVFTVGPKRRPKYIFIELISRNDLKKRSNYLHFDMRTAKQSSILAPRQLQLEHVIQSS